MEDIYSFVSIVGGQCGHDRRDRNRTTGCILYLVVSETSTAIRQCFCFTTLIMKLTLFWREHPSFPLHEILTR